MSAPYTKIRAAFVARLLTFPSLPSVAWENVPFTPTAGAVYLQPALMDGEPYQAEIGTNGQNVHNGIFQISIFAPAGHGTATINALRDNLVDYFKRGTVLTNSGVNVRISKAYPVALIQETDWIHIPVKINFTAYASN